ncbi:hypothetical protein RQM47_16005 [Rubrivirga sp. S365]|uniref:hypothetical protein n=1 Tax=Rubrivirga sp. S365 TaxID=3076080 RepID=UPI0028C7221C|nr:hypothetical protein [Rubrivirga sp. S365]MDT7858152.1 hypothetical protein [Rubrivirga sp. S365]
MRTVLLLAALASAPAAQVVPGPPTAPPGDDPLSALQAAADTSEAAFRASLRIEHARLALARDERRAAVGWRRWRPQLDLFLSVSTRGLAFPSVSSGGFDPAYAAIARWPGDTWGVTVSWSIDQVLDHRPAARADAAVALAEARISLHHARREQREAAARRRAVARAEREAERRRQAQAVSDALAARLRVEARFLARRLDAQRELLRLAQMEYEQGEADYAALARQRLAVLAAEHAHASNAARLTALDACPTCGAAGAPAPALADLDGTGEPAPPRDLPPRP